LRLPAELRLKIYRLLLTGKTIHIDGTIHNYTYIKRISQHDYELFYKSCTRHEQVEPLAHLIGTGHTQDPSSSATHSIRDPCTQNFKFKRTYCIDPVSLDVQLLRVCHQIYKEAALLPYAENHFITSHGLRGYFQKAFVTQFSLEKRAAMQTIAIFNNHEGDIGMVAELLPGLKRLWFDIEFQNSGGPQKTSATRHYELVEAYKKVELPKLIGVDVTYARRTKEDEGLEERLEHALLDNNSP
jgi:hypothetical protein